MADPNDASARFARFLDDPAAYVAAKKALDLEEVGRQSSSGRPVTVTARSLFLTRDVTVQASKEPIYIASERRFREPDWHVDTYLGGFGLPADVLERWANEGAAVLDLASGLSAFATEAAPLGIRVDCADAEVVDDHPMFDIAKHFVARSYVDQMAFLHCLAKDGRHARYRLDDRTTALLERIHAARQTIAATYPKPSGRRFRDDARELATVADDSYDAVLCGWLLVHLEEEDEMRVMRAAARVTRPGGELRFRAGAGGNFAKRFLGWFPGGELGKKRVSIDAASQDDLLILRIAAD